MPIQTTTANQKTYTNNNNKRNNVNNLKKMIKKSLTKQTINSMNEIKKLKIHTHTEKHTMYSPSHQTINKQIKSLSVYFFVYLP